MQGQWSRFWAFALRDGLLAALTAALWSLVLHAGNAAGIWPAALQVLTGLMTVLIAFFAHEWGHLIGAWLAGGVFELPASVVETPFLFRFDTARGSRRQFCSMSLGGFASSIVAVALLVLFLPRGLLASYVALGLTGLGVLATLITEIPGFLRVYHGGPMPSGSAYVSAAQTKAR